MARSRSPRRDRDHYREDSSRDKFRDNQSRSHRDYVDRRSPDRRRTYRESSPDERRHRSTARSSDYQRNYYRELPKQDLKRRTSRSPPPKRDPSRDRESSARPAYRPIKTETSDNHTTSSSSAVDAHNTTETDPEDIAALMGFGGFGSTKGDKVKGNDAGAVAKAPKKLEYRQYMNRPGGFNRPLDN